ncbi:MAG: amidase [Salinirussus sp.]
MTGTPLHHRSAAELARLVREGRTSPVDIIDATLDRIADRSDRTNAFATVCRDRARAAAEDLERSIDAGEDPGPLAGVPVAIKDLEDVAGVRTTYGSLLFENNVAERSAPFVERLEAAGAVVVGKTNTPEFALGTTTDNRLIGPTPTPFDLDRIAGGSSGGAGAALADGLVPLAQGSDTGGSIRIPAACCGVVGLKPTYGRIPLDTGVNAFGTHSPFRHLGPMTRTVEDTALALDVMAGSHTGDPFSLEDATNSYRAATRQPVDELDIAYSPGLGPYPVESRVTDVLDDAMDDLEAAGATVDRIDGPLEQDRETILETFYTLVVALFDGVLDDLAAQHGVDPRGADRDKLGDPIIETILDADPPTARDLAHANRRRTALYRDLEACFEEYDLLASATLGVVPFEIGNPPTEIDGESIEPARGWLLTQPYNLSGHPAVSMPAGFVDGLPVSLQLAAPRFDESTVLAASGVLERRRPWHEAYPY